MANTVHGKNTGLHGDKTSTGATCFASLTRSSVHGRYKLHIGDKTSPCPKCGKAGAIAEGNQHHTQNSVAVAVDGSPISCGCTPGTNYLIAPGVVTGGHSPDDRRNEHPSPNNTTRKKINFQCSDDNGDLLLQHHYQLVFPDGHTEEGRTDQNGRTAWHFAENTTDIHLNIFME